MTHASAASGGAPKRRIPLDLSTAAANLISMAALDLSTASTSARGGGGRSFNANFRQVTLEGTKARGRYLATRRQLDMVRCSPKDDGRFAEDIENTKAEVGALLDELVVDFQAMQEVRIESEEVSEQLAELVDNDAKLAVLLEKMNRKLDVFQLTLGNF